MVPDVVIRYRLEGEPGELAYRRLPFKWWSDIKAQAGFTPMSLLHALQDYDIDALVCIYWLIRRQSKHSRAFRQIYEQLTALQDRGEMPQLELVDIVISGESLLASLDPDTDADGITDDEDDDVDDGGELDPPASVSSSDQESKPS